MIKASGLTDTGKTRNLNQDAIFISAEPIGPLPNLFIVADGMGGHKGGEIASKFAIAYFTDYVRTAEDISSEDTLDLLTVAAKYANEEVLRQAELDPELSGMGTTFTACTIVLAEEYSKCNIIHIGDSRAYAITQGSVTQLTNDHSFVSEMMKAGQLSHSEAREHPKRNVLTRVLGPSLDMTADGYVYDIKQDRVILLCSDGLYNMLSEDEIRDLANNSDKPAEALIDAANEKGGLDNISVVLVKI